MTPSADILIKIFSGPHLGAEVPLPPGSFTLGSGSSCDIILQDTTVAERHLTLTVAEDRSRVSVSILDAPVSFVATENETDESGRESRDDEEERITQGTVPWPSQTLMMVGTCAIAWKKPEQDWGDIAGSASVLSTMPGPKKEAVVDEAGPADEEKKAKTIAVSPLARRVLKGAGVLLILLFVFGPCIGIKSNRMARDMKDLLEDEHFGFLTVSQTNIGVTIQGTVETQADRSRLWKLAGNAGYPVFIDIQVNEERAYAVKVALSVRGLFPEVELRDQDILIKGYMRDKLIEGASKIWIKNDISHVNAVESHMVYAFQVWPVLKDRLIKYKLSKLVVIRFHPGLVQVEGELDFDQRQTLEKVKEEVCDELGSPIAFWDTLTAPGFSKEWNDSLNGSLRSKFAPDPGLAQLFLDSQSAKGVPAFVAETPEYKVGDGLATVPVSPISKVPTALAEQNLDEAVKTAEKIKAADGRTLAVIRDKDGNIKGSVLLDNEGNMVKTPDGNPVFLPPITDKNGKAVLDKKGRPVFAEPLTGDQGRIIMGKGAKDKWARDDQGHLLVDENGRPIEGEVLRNADGSIKRGKDGSILVRDKDGNIVKAWPVQTDKKDKWARDDQGRMLVDENGRPIEGEVLRNADGSIKRDKDGNILVRDKNGNIVKARPIQIGEDMPAITGPILDGDGNVIRDKEGNPIMGRVAVDKNGQVVRDADGHPVILGAALDEKGQPLKDSAGHVIPLTIARNADGRVVRDKDGNPLLVPALLDQNGRVIRDTKGRPVAPRVISGANDNAVFDKDGRLILDKDANKVLTGRTDTDNPGGSQRGQMPGQEGKTASDKALFGSGTAVADKEKPEQEESPLKGLNITSITMEPIAFIGMRDGEKYFTGGKLPTGWVIRSIATDRIVVEKNGKQKTIKMRTE